MAFRSDDERLDLWLVSLKASSYFIQMALDGSATMHVMFLTWLAWRAVLSLNASSLVLLLFCTVPQTSWFLSGSNWFNVLHAPKLQAPFQYC